MAQVIRNKDLLPHNSFRMAVNCALWIEYNSSDDLIRILKDGNLPRPLLHIGGGSNLLFTGNWPGTVLHSAIQFIEPLGETIRVGAGVAWDDFCAWCAEKGLWGSENLSGIPGEVGAAAVQNIGAYGTEIKDIIAQVNCLEVESLRPVSLSAQQCSYGYRDSIFKNEAKGKYIVLSVVFRLSGAGPNLSYSHLARAVQAEGIEEQHISPSQMRNLVLKIRKEKLPDPSEIGSTGSFFKNPVVPEEKYLSLCKRFDSIPHFQVGAGRVKIPAAWLIEQCGWKGYREGNVGVYEKQPLVIVNATGKANPGEILAMEKKIKDSVWEKFGIELFPEVEHI